MTNLAAGRFAQQITSKITKIYQPLHVIAMYCSATKKKLMRVKIACHTTSPSVVEQP
jgi:hypothetical protein